MKSDFVFRPTISKDEIDSLPVKQFPGTIYYIERISDFQKIIDKLKSHSVFGIDTETRPSFKKGITYDVALLQLSNASEAFLIRLNKIGLPTEIAEILSNPNILKVGVALHDDIKSLRKLREFKPKGFIDLQTYVKDFGIIDNGLKKLTANILDFKISKRQQTSNWEADELSLSQIEYAATDAWVCHEIYVALNKLRNDRY